MLVGRKEEHWLINSPMALLFGLMFGSPVQQEVTAAIAGENESHPSAWQVIAHLEISLKEITQREKSNLH